MNKKRKNENRKEKRKKWKHKKKRKNEKRKNIKMVQNLEIKLYLENKHFQKKEQNQK